MSLQDERIFPLDALRGLAILAMVFSGVIPYGVLPRWMYHAQVPPPQHVFNPNLPGITWVDLVFPFFLFALGAAIPIALMRRIEKGAGARDILRYILERTLLLAFFAIYIQHIRPNILDPQQGTRSWLLALIGFLLLFPIFTRLPGNWSVGKRYGIKMAGWVDVLFFLFLLRYPDGSGFSLYRNDIIIVLLANGFFWGALCWFFTQQNVLRRLGILAMLLALRLSASVNGWVQSLMNYSPIPWIFRTEYVYYLFIVLPGTIAGEQFLAWRKNQNQIALSRLNGSALGMLCVGTIICLVIGLYQRWLLFGVCLAGMVIIIGLWLLRQPSSATDQLLQNLFHWGSYWIVTGLIFEAFESGIKKDPPTMSYYLITSGMALWLLIVFTIIVVSGKQRWLSLLSDNGQNPMIAYAAMANFIMPILNVTGLHGFVSSITSFPWIRALRAAIYTLILSLVIQKLTRWRIFWRT